MPAWTHEIGIYDARVWNRSFPNSYHNVDAKSKGLGKRHVFGPNLADLKGTCASDGSSAQPSFESQSCATESSLLGDWLDLRGFLGGGNTSGGSKFV